MPNKKNYFSYNFYSIRLEIIDSIKGKNASIEKLNIF